jgi:hypothetical protein
MVADEEGDDAGAIENDEGEEEEEDDDDDDDAESDEGSYNY